MIEDGSHWYVARTRSRHEKMVAGLLARRGVEHFLPLARVLSRWADRKKWVEKPLFPGYLFVHIHDDEIPFVRETRGLAAFVGAEPYKPSVVPDEEVQNVRRLIASGEPVQAYPYLEPGSPVRIKKGPLRDVEGTLLRRKGRHFLVVSVPIIGRSSVVEVPAECIEAL